MRNIAADKSRQDIRVQSPTIFLVEDNPADVELFREAMSANSVQAKIRVATDGSEGIRLMDAVDAAQLDCPDLIVLDINLPIRSGLQVLRRIRLSPKLQSTPVAVMSSSDSPADRREAERLGASRYIQKPLSLLELGLVGQQLAALLPDKKD